MGIHWTPVLLLVTWLLSVALGEIPTIDAVFSEWRGEHVVSRDEVGDATGSFDVTRLAAVTNGTELYLHFDIGTEINLQNGDEGNSFSAEYIWNVTGSIVHRRHIHERVNRYHADFVIQAVDGQWKITNMEVLSQERL